MLDEEEEGRVFPKRVEGEADWARVYSPRGAKCLEAVALDTYRSRSAQPSTACEGCEFRAGGGGDGGALGRGEMKGLGFEEGG